MAVLKLAPTLGVAEADRAPVFGDGDVEVEEVVAVENHVLAIDLGPAHSQGMHEGEIARVPGSVSLDLPDATARNGSPAAVSRSR